MIPPHAMYRMANDPSRTDEERDAAAHGASKETGTQPVERHRWLWPLIAWLAIAAALGGTLWYAFKQTDTPRADPPPERQKQP